MNEEEKKAIEYWKRDIQLYHYNTQLASEYYAQIILNLIEKQQKELNSLKEIEKSHQEENGKLRIELEQYKLLEANIDKANKIIAENKFDEGLYGLLMQEKEKNKELEKENKNLNILLDAKYKDVTYMLLNYISKDKIKEKIVEIINSSSRYNVLCKINENEETRRTRYAVAVLKELLEEK